MADNGRSRHWLELYREAVLEPDSQKMRTLAAQAHRAIQNRALELWYAGAPVTSERLKLDAAAHFLGLLRVISGRQHDSSGMQIAIPAR